MDMLPRRKRGRPKGSKNKAKKDFEKVYGEDKYLAIMKQMDSYKAELADMKTKLARVSGEKAEAEEKVVPLNEKLLENGNILNPAERATLERKVKEYESMLRTKETLMNRFYGKHGYTEVFSKNEATDKRVILSRLIKAKITLDKGSHGRVSSSDRKKLVLERKKLERILKDTLPSMNACNDPKKADDLSRYLAEHQKKYGRLMAKLQNINKVLEPDNPNGGSLKYLWRE